MSIQLFIYSKTYIKYKYRRINKLPYGMKLLSGISGLALLLGVSPAQAQLSIDIDYGEVATVPGNRPSVWDISGDYLYVGNRGSGKLEISNGGIVTAYSANVGFRDGSNGSITVSGTGS